MQNLYGFIMEGKNNKKKTDQTFMWTMVIGSFSQNTAKRIKETTKKNNS